MSRLLPVQSERETVHAVQEEERQGHVQVEIWPDACELITFGRLIPGYSTHDVDIIHVPSLKGAVRVLLHHTTKEAKRG